METKLEKLRGELIADIEKEIRRRGVINYENNECIELPCYPGSDGCGIEHNSEVVYMARIVYVPATLIGLKDKTLVTRVSIETDSDEHVADDLYADDLEEILNYIRNMKDHDLYLSRKFYDEYNGQFLGEI